MTLCGVLRSVLPAEVAPVAAAGMVAVFEHGEGLGEALRAEIDGEHRCGVGLPAPADELVGADCVGLGRAPGIVEARRPLVARPDAVDPVIVGDEIAAGIADQGELQVADEIENVAAEPLLVGRRVTGFVNAAINGPAEVLEKGAVDAVVDVANSKIPMHRNPCLHWPSPGLSSYFWTRRADLVKPRTTCQRGGSCSIAAGSSRRAS